MQQQPVPDNSASLRRWSIIIFCVSVALLLPVLYVGIYNHPSPLDDYDYAEWGDYRAMQAELYLGWSGRYVCNLALTLCPLHWHSFGAYRIVVIALTALFMLCTGTLIGKGLKAYTNMPAYVCRALAALAVLLMVNNMPSLVEGFFWYSSLVTHVLSVIFIGIWLRVVIHIDIRSDRHPSAGNYVYSALLLAAAIGCNEGSLVLCDVLCLLLWLCYRQAGRADLRRFYVVLFVVCVLCSAVSILAPGNAARQSVTGRNLWMVWPTWLYFTQKLVFRILLNPFLHFFSVVFLVFAGRFRAMRPATNLIVAFAVPLGIIFLLCLPPHYALGTAPPRRVVNIVYVFFVMGWMFFLLQLSAHLDGLWRVMGDAASTVQKLLGIAAIVLLMAGFARYDKNGANIYVVARGLAKGIPQAFDAELNARYQQMRSSPEDTLAVPRIKTEAGNILYFVDIGPDCAYGTNQFYGRYWGKKCVYIY